MTYLVACTTATLFLIAFLVSSFFMHLARWAQHKRCTRELALFQEALDASIARLEALSEETIDLSEANQAATHLDAGMKRTIAEGIELAGLLHARNAEMATLVNARREQRLEEATTLTKWIEVRDDLMKFAAQYPDYVFSSGERGQG